MILLLFAYLVFVLSLARPQYGNKQKKINDSGRDLVVVVDTSGSMKALDFKIEGENTDRLSVVKQVLKKFVQKRQGDRISVQEEQGRLPAGHRDDRGPGQSYGRPRKEEDVVRDEEHSHRDRLRQRAATRRRSRRKTGRHIDWGALPCEGAEAPCGDWWWRDRS